MAGNKDRLLSRSDDELIEAATDLAAADNDLIWALIQARKDAGFSQRELAEYLGVKQSTISAFESPENNPRLSTIRRYALAVGARICHQIDTESRTVTSGGWTPVELHSSVVDFVSAAPTESRTTAGGWTYFTTAA